MNLFDYLDWRGDLTFDKAPLNEVDSLILSKLSVMDLTGLAPGPKEDGSVTLTEASRAFWLSKPEGRIHLGLLIPDTVPELFRRLPDYPRFKNIRLSRYVNQVDDEKNMQFSAVTCDVDDGTRYVAFRGTDDTLVGWKENFMMSFLEAVPAQKEAVEYLRGAAMSSTQPLRVGGHSKGGNLAVYAAMQSPPEIQSRILDIYNFDGPGFGKSALTDPGYLSIRSRVHTLLPQSSMVGILLEHEEDYKVVKSTGVGPYQHDGFTWEVRGTHFVKLPELSGVGRHRDRVVKAWVSEVPPDQRERFTQALFDILESTGARTLTELTTAKLKTASTLIKNYRHLDKGSQEMLTHVLTLLLRESARRAKRGD